MKQQKLFDDSPKDFLETRSLPPLERFQGAMLYSAIGDALGWPTEFIHPQKKKNFSFELPVRHFISWEKTVGGKWWGHTEEVSPGEYSDDTQLTLALSRCISDSGEFIPEYFALMELPLWLDYERGGGKTLKIAARNLQGKKANWRHNFYQTADVQYRDAGANGAAMRNLPIALTYCGNEDAIITNSFLNSIITHGHPRAIIGAIIFGLAVNYILLASNEINFNDLFEYLHKKTKNIGNIVKQNKDISRWLQDWDIDRNADTNFASIFNNSYKETLMHLKEIPSMLADKTEHYYEKIGALDPTTKGSGVVTACAAIYLFLKYADQPEEGLIASANILGSDTDTIGCLLGALLGSHNGLSNMSSSFTKNLQDNMYILETAQRLHRIAATHHYTAETTPINQKNIQHNLEKWETELNKMLANTINIEDTLHHPALGRGTLLKKAEKPTLRQGYITKLFTVKFDCGQTCIFHARIERT